LTALTEPAAVVLSELMTNSVRHAKAPGREIETRYERLVYGVRLEVHDASPEWPLAGKPGDDDEAGRGLLIVDALTHGQWGVSARAGIGKKVWASITTDPDGEAV
jgi:anti-sigma regulatory factor (Ser/Thr protein kinase)